MALSGRTTTRCALFLTGTLFTPKLKRQICTKQTLSETYQYLHWKIQIICRLGLTVSDKIRDISFQVVTAFWGSTSITLEERGTAITNLNNFVNHWRSSDEVLVVWETWYRTSYCSRKSRLIIFHTSAIHISRFHYKLDWWLAVVLDQWLWMTSFYHLRKTSILRLQVLRKTRWQSNYCLVLRRSRCELYQNFHPKGVPVKYLESKVLASNR